jgi:enoyl-CoA hydratase
MEYKILQKELTDGVATITISRPKALNALNSQFFDELDSMIEELNKDEDVRVVILTGEGKAFVAGADIAEMVDMNSEEGKAFGQRGQRSFRNIELAKMPFIAMVNGFALGGGLELAMACDIRIAGEKAKFGMPEVNLGLIPGYAGTQRLPSLVGPGNAKYLIYSAEVIDAATALNMGLVQKVVAQDELAEVCNKFAEQIASKGPDAVRNAKKVIDAGIQLGLEKGSEVESEAFGSLFGNQGTEGMQAFLEKRNPNW